MRGDDDDDNVGVDGADLAGGVEAALRAELDVHQDHVGTPHTSDVDRLGDGVGGADALEVRLGVESE